IICDVRRFTKRLLSFFSVLTLLLKRLSIQYVYEHFFLFFAPLEADAKIIIFFVSGKLFLIYF
ncbi:hypothetical protein, partial [Flavobacterium branchiophilum]|uniref:hypothetical protein n=1 Tax=Flavobacterium branchiophilum TaxID=55197 RepID=UPI001A9CA35E